MCVCGGGWGCLVERGYSTKQTFTLGISPSSSRPPCQKKAQTPNPTGFTDTCFHWVRRQLLVCILNGSGLLIIKKKEQYILGWEMQDTTYLYSFAVPASPFNKPHWLNEWNKQTRLYVRLLISINEKLSVHLWLLSEQCCLSEEVVVMHKVIKILDCSALLSIVNNYLFYFFPPSSFQFTSGLLSPHTDQTEFYVV